MSLRPFYRWKSFWFGVLVVAIFSSEHYGWQLEVAYWFLMLLFLVPWSGWLAWRWRRMKEVTRIAP